MTYVVAFYWPLGPDHVHDTHRSPQGIGATRGAAAAAALLARLDETGMRYALSCAAQQVSRTVQLGFRQ